MGGTSADRACQAASWASLIVVNIMVFFLAFFLDFFELVHRGASARPGGRQTGHRPDLVRCAAGHQHADIVRHPPFGFALFYLLQRRPTKEYMDKVTRR